MTFRVLAAIVGGAVLFISGGAQSQTTNVNFNVSASLASRCVTAATSPAVNFGQYTAFQNTDLVATQTLSFNCTRGITPTITLKPPGGSAAASPVKGVIGGLQFSLAAAQDSATLGASATASVVGGPDIRSYTITGTLAANQPGCAGAGNTGDSCGTDTQLWTLVLAY